MRVERHRVVITGIGAITPLGCGAPALWKALLAGRCAVGALTRFDASSYPTRIAAQIDDFVPADHLTKRRAQWTDRFSQFAVAAARMAIEDARFDPRAYAAQIGVFTGSALGGVAFAEEQMAAFARDGLRGVRPLLSLCVFGGAAASNVAIEFAITGPASANANSCASGAMAIGEAFSAVRRGDLRAAIAGGAEAPLAPLTFGAFTVARAMSTCNDDPGIASRPFDRNRDGFVMAEGSGMVVLERYEDAVARGAQPYAEVCGYGASNDAHHMSAPLADGMQTAVAIERALADGEIRADEIVAINTHGSSTRLGDASECASYARVFGPRISSIPASATKGQHGHALGATGAWEIAIAALSIRDRRLPGTINLRELDPECTIDCSVASRALAHGPLLSNSSGFGGMNAALVLRPL